MFISQTTYRIHYSLTDQMGVVYHGNYAQFYEIGRAEAIRTMGFTYKEIEKMGIIMPVVELKSRFLRPAKYDDLITIVTKLPHLPTDHKIHFLHEIYNEEKLLLNTGEVTLFMLEAQTMQKTTLPEPMLKAYRPYFSQ